MFFPASKNYAADTVIRVGPDRASDRIAAGRLSRTYWRHRVQGERDSGPALLSQVVTYPKWAKNNMRPVGKSSGENKSESLPFLSVTRLMMFKVPARQKTHLGQKLKACIEIQIH